MILLSAYQARKFLPAGDKATASLDLGLTESEIRREGEYFIFPDGQKLGIADIKKIIKKDTMCFLVENSSIIQVAIFSEELQRYYKLVPTGYRTPPTIEISGIRMHVTKKFSPLEDTEQKINFVAPCTGTVLDTCCGLGYTAIKAAETAEIVYTIEIDPNVAELQKINPWSKELFDNKKIKMIIGDAFAEIKKFPNAFFDRVIHDPPRLALSTLLYSQEFYNQLYRVMKPGGKLYHYTGDPGSKKRGMDIRAGIIKRLEKAGFRNMQRVFNGVTAEKL